MSTGVKYVPIPSLSHELGILFGFAGLMLVCMVVYTILWKRYQKKVAHIEDERRKALEGSALYSDRDEKGDMGMEHRER